jgi:hypothetical protein
MIAVPPFSTLDLLLQGCPKPVLVSISLGFLSALRQRWWKYSLQLKWSFELIWERAGAECKRHKIKCEFKPGETSCTKCTRSGIKCVVNDFSQKFVDDDGMYVSWRIFW